MSGSIADNVGTGSGVISAPSSAIESSSDPLKTTNPASGVGTEWHNTTSGDIFICTDATSNLNVWEGQAKKTAGIEDRGIWFGGSNGLYRRAVDIHTKIDYITISNTGNASTFGNLTGRRYQPAGTSNGTNGRGVSAGGINWYSGIPNDDKDYSNSMEYITISTLGDSTVAGNQVDRGSSPTNLRSRTACSNATDDRGILWGGEG